jgi:hypothetical protein
VHRARGPAAIADAAGGPSLTLLSLSKGRQRLGEAQRVALVQESLAVAHKTGALATRDLERVVVDTTVQPKAIAHPTDARRCHRALAKLVDLAKRNDVGLRQSYRRLAKRAAIMVGRYTHAHRFRRVRRALKFLRPRLRRVIRDIRRKTAGNPRLTERFADLLALAVRVRFQDHRQPGPKVYALHAPESLPRRRCLVPEDWRDGPRLWQAVEWLKQRLRPSQAQLVPVVHGKDPCARSATPASLAGRRVGGACGPTGASVSRTQPRGPSAHGPDPWGRNRPVEGNAG